MGMRTSPLLLPCKFSRLILGKFALMILRPTVAVSGKEAVNGNGNAKKTQ
jgi:hypothetical protein